jgi:GNAT superfamily N-acetyltransferase
VRSAEGPEALGGLAQLCEVALGGEDLDEDALETCCGAEGSVVLGDDPTMAAAVVAPGAEPGRHHLQLLAVVPSQQGLGLGRQLVEQALGLARDAGSSELVLGGVAHGGRYLWPGVDVRWVRMLALAESLGVRWTDTALNLACPSTVRAPLPDGVQLVRAIDDADVARAAEFVAQRWPQWSAEAARAIDHGTLLLAVDGETVLGFACHSVNRLGWFGPTGVDDSARGRGIGAALLGEACRDLMAAGTTRVEISWVGPVAFYAKVAGAVVSRVFRTGVLTV